MTQYESIKESEWRLLEPLLPKPIKRGRGKPHTPWKAVLNSILFVLATGTKWDALPKSPEFASKSAAHRWFICWQKSGLLEQILDTLHGEKKTTLISHRAVKQRLATQISEQLLRWPQFNSAASVNNGI